MKREMKRTKDTDWVAILILAVFGLVIGAVSLVVLYIYPVVILSCRYTETEQVDCEVQDRMFGLIPIREQSIANIKKAYVSSEVRKRLRPRGEIIENKVYKLVLVNSSGTVTLDGLDEFGGIFVNRSVDAVNEYLLAQTDEPLRIWQATWVPLVLGSFFLLVSLVMLYSVVDSLIRRMSKSRR